MRPFYCSSVLLLIAFNKADCCNDMKELLNDEAGNIPFESDEP